MNNISKINDKVDYKGKSYIVYNENPEDKDAWILAPDPEFDETDFIVVKKVNIDAKNVIVDFLENEETKETWDSFIAIMFDKFGDEIAEMLYPICERTEYSYSKPITKRKI
jgi:hypothetical protein